MVEKLATVAPLLIWPAPAAVKGLVTDFTFLKVVISSSICSALALRGALSTVPEVACRTIWSVPPEAAGKSFARRFSASADWVPGSSNFEEKAVPVARWKPKKPTSATSHKARTT